MGTWRDIWEKTTKPSQPVAAQAVLARASQQEMERETLAKQDYAYKQWLAAQRKQQRELNWDLGL